MESIEVLERLASISICNDVVIRLSTERPIEFIDLTDRLHQIVTRARVHCGVLNVQTLHTTTGIVVNELEPLLLDDFSTMLDGAAPRAAAYGHDDVSRRTVNLTTDERINGHAHCRALLLGSAVSLNVADGRLKLGQWQRVLMVELDGPRPRDISVVVLGTRRP